MYYHGQKIFLPTNALITKLILIVILIVTGALKR